jgi:hypothetical protein
MQYIYIEFSNGELYRLNPFVVASDRAKYYSNQDKFTEAGKRQAYEEELEEALREKDYLTDWLGNNMNWEDIEEYVVKIERTQKPFVYQLGQANLSVKDEEDVK